MLIKYELYSNIVWQEYDKNITRVWHIWKDILWLPQLQYSWELDIVIVLVIDGIGKRFIDLVGEKDIGGLNLQGFYKFLNF